MSKFALKEITAIVGRQKVYELVIDNKGQLETFETDLEKVYKGRIKTLLTYIELFINGHSLPTSKFRDLTPKKEMIKEYEFKQNPLRIYAIKISEGQIILYCGHKNTQREDINRFRSLKNQFLESIKIK